MKIFGVSYSNDLSAKHAADFRAIVQSDWYRRAFSNMRVERVADSDVFTTKRGFRRSTSVHAKLTGLGGDMIIIDDPQKPVDAQSNALRNSLNQWFTNTLLSRLDNKATGVIILVMQRVHLHDLTGFLVENSSDWTVLSLPPNPTKRSPSATDSFSCAAPVKLFTLTMRLSQPWRSSAQKWDPPFLVLNINSRRCPMAGR